MKKRGILLLTCLVFMLTAYQKGSFAGYSSMTFFGDSLTADADTGYWIEDDLIWPNFLRASLLKDGGTFNNLAVPGYFSSQILIKLFRIVSK